MSQKTPPEPVAPPVVGTLASYLSDELTFLEECAGYGDVVHRPVWGRASYYLFHPDHVERVLRDEPDAFAMAQFDALDVSPSCSGSDGGHEDQSWQKWSRMIDPAFDRDLVASFVDVMARRTIETVETLPTGEPFDLGAEVKDLVLEIMVQTLFGEHRVDDMDRFRAEYRTVSDWLNSDRFAPVWAPTVGNWRLRQSTTFLEDEIEAMIERGREDDREGESLLSAMLSGAPEDGSDVTEADLTEELLVMLGAATETTALALLFTIYLVVEHPAVERKLRAESDRVLGDSLPTPDDVEALSYTDRVVKESLRLYPPVFDTVRRTKTDVTFGGYTVPAGQEVSLPQWVVHRDERWYDDPEAFRPDRWTGNSGGRPDFAYFPFGGALKTAQCISQSFAKFELDVIVSTMVRRLDVERVTDRPLDLETALFLNPADALEVVVEPRQT